MIDDLECRGSGKELNLRTVGDVLNADVLENLEPPPDEAFGQEAAYYMQLAQMIDRLRAGRSRQSIARAQDLVDRIWEARPPHDAARQTLTVREVLARAARKRNQTQPPPNKPIPSEPLDRDRVFAALIQVITSTRGRPPPNWRETVLAMAASAPAQSSEQDTSIVQLTETPSVTEDLVASEPEALSAVSAAPEEAALPAATPSDEGELHTTQRTKPWPEEFDADLGEMPLEPDEMPDKYICYFNYYRQQQYLSTLPHWKAFKAGMDQKYIREREYLKEFIANGSKTPARIAYEQARAKGDRTAVWFDWEGRGEYRQ